MGYLRNTDAKSYSMKKRKVRFSILTPNPLVSRKVTHDSEVTKYRDTGINESKYSWQDVDY